VRISVSSSAMRVFTNEMTTSPPVGIERLA
jgi:hypothetical protein